MIMQRFLRNLALFVALAVGATVLPATPAFAQDDADPMAQPDVVLIEVDEQAVIDVLANDDGPEIDPTSGVADDDDAGEDLDTALPLVFELAVDFGAVEVGIDDEDGLGRLLYTPPVGFDGIAVAEYLVCWDLICEQQTVTIYVGYSQCTIEGTANDDVLIGTGGDDVICAKGGADEIRGRGGDDLIFAGRGADWIHPGGGADLVFAGRGADTIVASNGPDVLYGGRGIDTIDGGGGDDFIAGNNGADVLIGGDGDDLIRGGGGADNITGDAGSDDLRGGDGQDTIAGGGGDDTLRGNRGADTLDGNGGNDLIRGGRGDDVATGGNGEDTLRGGSGSDDLSGGADNDYVRGGNGPDVLAGNGGDDLLRGRSGADDLSGGDGEDILRGGDGADVLSGGQGNDKLSGGDGDDTLRGNRGDDLLRGRTGFDVLNGGNDTDTCLSGEDVTNCEDDVDPEIDTDGDGDPDVTDPDDDNDGVLDEDDAFPLDPTETTDTDGDGTGDNADPDDDNDGVLDADDAFPLDPSESADADGDGVGDNADDDDDNDGVLDVDDAFPLDPSESADSDGDGVGDNADAFPNDPTETSDTDGDGVGDNADVFPDDPTESADSDGDGVGDNADAFPDDPTESADSDGDGVGDNADAFPDDPTESLDSDGDGVGDNADAFPDDPTEQDDTDEDGVGDNADAFPFDPTETTDSDGDGVGDNEDAFPNDPSEQYDNDGDGIGDNADVDDDNDGTPDVGDAFPFDDSESEDSDGGGVGDNEDPDDDNDGVDDIDDLFPGDPAEQYDNDGDGIGDNADVDDDNDGTPDEGDAFPFDPSEDTDTDNDGEGDGSDPDIDGDGVPNGQDAFPALKWYAEDTDGDGIADVVDLDVDGDGVPDGQDDFPNDPSATRDTDRDGVPDESDPDIDGDGVENGDDAFPSYALESRDTDGDGIGDLADPDLDGDGILDVDDLDDVETLDSDDDGVPDDLDVDPADPAEARWVSRSEESGVAVRVVSEDYIGDGTVGIEIVDLPAEAVPDLAVSTPFEIDFLVEDVAFDTARLVLPFDTASITSAAEVDVWTLDETYGLWVPDGVIADVDLAGGTVTVDVSHFSPWLVTKRIAAVSLPEDFATDECEAGSTATVVLVDLSGSMYYEYLSNGDLPVPSDPGGERFTLAQRLAAELPLGEGLSILGFGAEVALAPAASTRSAAQSHVDALRSAPPLSGSQFDAALEAALLRLSETNAATKSIVLLTDRSIGGSVSPALADAVSALEVSTILFGPGADEDNPQAIEEISDLVVRAPATDGEIAQIIASATDVAPDEQSLDGDTIADFDEACGLYTSNGTWTPGGVFRPQVLTSSTEELQLPADIASDEAFVSAAIGGGFDTDGDLIPDDLEIGGANDLRDDPRIAAFYASLIDQGITKIYNPRSDPDSAESVLDFPYGPPLLIDEFQEANYELRLIALNQFDADPRTSSLGSPLEDVPLSAFIERQRLLLEQLLTPVIENGPLVINSGFLAPPGSDSVSDFLGLDDLGGRFNQVPLFDFYNNQIEQTKRLVKTVTRESYLLTFDELTRLRRIDEIETSLDATAAPADLDRQALNEEKIALLSRLVGDPSAEAKVISLISGYGMPAARAYRIVLLLDQPPTQQGAAFTDAFDQHRANLRAVFGINSSGEPTNDAGDLDLEQAVYDAALGEYRAMASEQNEAWLRGLAGEGFGEFLPELSELQQDAFNWFYFYGLGVPATQALGSPDIYTWGNQLFRLNGFDGPFGEGRPEFVQPLGQIWEVMRLASALEASDQLTRLIVPPDDVELPPDFNPARLTSDQVEKFANHLAWYEITAPIAQVLDVERARDGRLTRVDFTNIVDELQRDGVPDEIIDELRAVIEGGAWDKTLAEQITDGLETGLLVLTFVVIGASLFVTSPLVIGGGVVGAAPRLSMAGRLVTAQARLSAADTAVNIAQGDDLGATLAALGVVGDVFAVRRLDSALVAAEQATRRLERVGWAFTTARAGGAHYDVIRSFDDGLVDLVRDAGDLPGVLKGITEVPAEERGIYYLARAPESRTEFIDNALADPLEDWAREEAEYMAASLEAMVRGAIPDDQLEFVQRFDRLFGPSSPLPDEDLIPARRFIRRFGNGGLDIVENNAELALRYVDECLGGVRRSLICAMPLERIGDPRVATIGASLTDEGFGQIDELAALVDDLDLEDVDLLLDSLGVARTGSAQRLVGMATTAADHPAVASAVLSGVRTRTVRASADPAREVEVRLHGFSLEMDKPFRVIAAAETGAPFPAASPVTGASPIQDRFEAVLPDWVADGGIPGQNLDPSDDPRVFFDINGDTPGDPNKKPDNRFWGLFHDSYNPQDSTGVANLFRSPFGNKFRKGQTQRLEYGIGNRIEDGTFADLDAVFAEFDRWMATQHGNNMSVMLSKFTYSDGVVQSVPIQVRFWDYTTNADGTLTLNGSRLLVFADWRPGYRGVPGL